MFKPLAALKGPDGGPIIPLVGVHLLVTKGDGVSQYAAVFELLGFALLLGFATWVIDDEQHRAYLRAVR